MRDGEVQFFFVAAAGLLLHHEAAVSRRDWSIDVERIRTGRQEGQREETRVIERE